MSKIKKKKKDEHLEELGLSDKMRTKKRFINKDGSLNIVRKGDTQSTLYHHLMKASWFSFFVQVMLYYILVNAVFAAIYVWLGVENLNGIERENTWEDFSQAFFFSVQTFTTVGYGAVSPEGMATNYMASFEALIGLLSAAVATGLLLTRFTKPISQIIYSKNAVVAPFKDGKALMVRVVNSRDNKIMNLEAKLSATWHETENGMEVRKYAQLELERDKIFLFPLSWTIVHRMNEDSPFFDRDELACRKMKVEFLLMLEGYDESYNKMIYSNTSYTIEEVIWNARFEMMYHSDEKRGTILELDKIDDIERLD